MRIISLLALIISFIGCNNPKQKQPTPVERKAVSTKPDSLMLMADEMVDTTTVVPYWNDVARFIAGLPVRQESPLFKYTELPIWKEHQKAFDKGWAYKKEQMLDSLSAWAKREFEESRSNPRDVFYPFSGADFVTIYTIYPNSTRYVMFGLEPEGEIPPIERLSPDRITVNLLNVRYSMDDILQFSFFKTIDMHGDFRRCEWKGTLPLLLAFIARTGNEVMNLYRIRIDEQGNVRTDSTAGLLQNPDDNRTTGYRIVFRPVDDGPIQTLDYFSVNVFDPHLKNNTTFLKMLDQLRPTLTYVKSASYLMHKSSFSIIRDKVLEVSSFLLQDDSGIPYRFFDPNIWNITLYGTYMQPIPLFANHYQIDFLNQYKKNAAEVRPLNFGIGYRFQRGTSNLIIARKKKDS